MTVQFPKLEPWQRDCFTVLQRLSTDIDHDSNSWIVIKSRRQVGKSALLKVALLYVSLLRKNAVSIFCSPVISQSRKVFDEVAKSVPSLISKSNASTLSLEFINGSKIDFVSSEQGKSIRGKTVKGGGLLVVDEAAFVSDDFFYGILVPTTNVNKSTILIASSPFVRKGFFYDLFEKGGEGIYTFDWCLYDTSKYLSDDMLQRYRDSLPRRIFQTEYMGEFADGDSYIFGDFKDCINDHYQYRGGDVILGVDWGSGSGEDYTVISVIEKQQDKIVVLKQIAFNDKGPEATIEEIKHLNAFYNAKLIIVEKNSIGKVYLDLLRKQLKNVKPFETTNSSKNSIINSLALKIERKEIIIPKDRALIAELSFFQSKVNKNGTVTYSAPNGQHDDRVMSLAIGLSGFKNSYTIR